MRRFSLLFLGALSAVLLIAACGRGPATTGTPIGAPGVPPVLQMTSEAFEANGALPDKYTCTGENVSPPLRWTQPPADTKSLAVFMDDPDGGNWVHWILYNLPPRTTALPEAIPTNAGLPDGSRQGQNSFKKIGYGGPCPPSGTHHYVFRVYALDTTLALDEGATKNELFKAIEGHVVAQGELVGLYSK